MGITLKQFAELQNRAAGKRPARSSTRAEDAPPARRPQVILGIDPSLRGTGYGIIRTGPSTPTALAQGTIKCPPAWPQSRCLARIATELREVIRRTRPTVCVVEGIFFAQNLRTAIIMGAARGAAIAVVAGEGLEVFEIATRKVKQAIVGYGGAQKSAVAKMVQRMLNLAELPAPDAADALALALAFAHEHGRPGPGRPKLV